MNINKKTLASLVVLTALLSTSALAQKNGGGGGGGGSTTEPGTPLTLLSALKTGGTVPTWSGSYTITPSSTFYYPYDLVDISVKGKPINLFDGAPMRIVAYFSDALTGQPAEIVTGPYFYCMKKVGSTKSSFILYSYGAPIVRHLDGIVIEDVAGNILATAKG